MELEEYGTEKVQSILHNCVCNKFGNHPLRKVDGIGDELNVESGKLPSTHAATNKLTETKVSKDQALKVVMKIYLNKT